eukprot:c7425_g1_i1.p1 GENE.c7425_g1_i1~~c7425_g1_i1.p1  ORF type:complete len:194 (+),score=41.57 c7425_g1_i1:604-1185(+)
MYFAITPALDIPAACLSEPPQTHISRAFFKIKEATHRFSIPVGDSTTCLDIGAAPGGWSEFVAERGGRVVAVDPSPVHIPTHLAAKVTHIPSRIEDIPDVLAHGSFSLVLCDMNLHWRSMLNLIKSLPLDLVPDAKLVLTFKCVAQTNPDALKAVYDEACAIMSPRFKSVGFTQLLANRSREWTFVAELASSQ